LRCSRRRWRNKKLRATTEAGPEGTARGTNEEKPIGEPSPEQLPDHTLHCKTCSKGAEPPAASKEQSVLPEAVRARDAQETLPETSVPGAGKSRSSRPPAPELERRQKIAETAFPGQQSEGNCAPEVARQISNVATQGQNIMTELEMIEWAKSKGYYDTGSGTVPGGVERMLNDLGVPAESKGWEGSLPPLYKPDYPPGYSFGWTPEQQAMACAETAKVRASMDARKPLSDTARDSFIRGPIADAVDEGKGVQAHVETGKLLGDPTEKGGHSVWVTGVERMPDGGVTDFIINDTGTGQAGRRVPADQFIQSVIGGSDSFTVTRDPIW
jgi:hypothetical protein